MAVGGNANKTASPLKRPCQLSVGLTIYLQIDCLLMPADHVSLAWAHLPQGLQFQLGQ